MDKKQIDNAIKSSGKNYFENYEKYVMEIAESIKKEIEKGTTSENQGTLNLLATIGVAHIRFTMDFTREVLESLLLSTDHE